jgi:hypothetical protein
MNKAAAIIIDSTEVLLPSQAVSRMRSRLGAGSTHFKGSKPVGLPGWAAHYQQPYHIQRFPKRALTSEKACSFRCRAFFLTCLFFYHSSF